LNRKPLPQSTTLCTFVPKNKPPLLRRRGCFSSRSPLFFLSLATSPFPRPCAVSGPPPKTIRENVMVCFHSPLHYLFPSPVTFETLFFFIQKAFPLLTKNFSLFPSDRSSPPVFPLTFPTRMNAFLNGETIFSLGRFV